MSAELSGPGEAPSKAQAEATGPKSIRSEAPRAGVRSPAAAIAAVLVVPTKAVVVDTAVVAAALTVAVAVVVVVAVVTVVVEVAVAPSSAGDP